MIARAGGVSPDAGQILNEIEQTLPEIDMQEFEVEPEVEEEAIDPDEPKVYIQGFRIIGNESLDRFTLDQFLKDYRKKQLPISTIRSLNAELANYYRQQGFVAQVILPDQDITEGIVTMQVVEAELAESLGIKRTLLQAPPHLTLFGSQKANTENSMPNKIICTAQRIN